jgi:hypothetical protein
VTFVFVILETISKTTLLSRPNQFGFETSTHMRVPLKQAGFKATFNTTLIWVDKDFSSDSAFLIM